MEQKIIKMVTSPANNSVHSLCSQATRTSNAFLEETWVHKMALHIMVADTQTQSKITPPQARISECTYRWYSLKSSGGNFFTWKQRKPSCLCPPCLPMCTAPTSCRKKKKDSVCRLPLSQPDSRSRSRQIYYEAHSHYVVARALPSRTSCKTRMKPWLRTKAIQRVVVWCTNG